MDKEVSGDKLKQYWSVFNDAAEYPRRIVDTAVYDEIQPHYVANPVMSGIEDPIRQRGGLLEGDKEEVEISREWIFMESRPGAYVDVFDRMGDDKEGFHDPILQGINAFLREFGKPNKEAREQLKNFIRERLDIAEKGDGREADIRRYKSDKYLDDLIDGGIKIGMAGNVISAHDMQSFREDFVYLILSKGFYKLSGKVAYDKEGMDAAYAHLTGGKKITPHLLADPEFRRADAIQLVPGNEERFVEEDGKILLNIWNPRIEPTHGNIQWFIDHVDFLCDGISEQTEHLLDFLTHIVVNPGRKISHAAIIGSEVTGTGKSLLKLLLRNIMGHKNVGEITDDILKERYNSWMAKNELIIIEEIMASGRYDIANKLKPYITEDEVQIRDMYQSSYPTKNRTNFILFSNHENAVALHQGDRRYWVTFSKSDRKEFVYYEQLVKKINEKASDVYGWMLERDMSEWKPDAPPPVTEARREMERASKAIWEEFLYHALLEESRPFDVDIIVPIQVFEAVRRKGIKLRPNDVVNFLRREGAYSLGQKRLAPGRNSKKARMWAVRNVDKWKFASEDEIRDELANSDEF